MYDYIIVGAGLAGLNTAQLLLEKYPNSKICIIEKSNKIGGMIQSKYINFDGLDIKYESGGAVIYGYQKNMLHLIKKYNIEMSSMNLKDKVKDYFDSYCNYSKKHDHHSRFKLLLKKVFNYMNKKGDKFCREFNLEQICLQAIGLKDTQFIEKYYGYSGEFKLANAVVARKNIENEVFNSKKMFFFKKGYSTLLEEIYNSIESKVDLKLNTTMNYFDNNNNEILVKINNNAQLKCQKIILTIPKQHLVKQTLSFNENELKLLDSVDSFSLTRVFLGFDIKKNKWLQKLNHTTLNNPLRQIITLSKSKGLFQIYNDWQYADAFGALNKENTIKNSRLLLDKVFKSKVGQPTFYKKYYWKNAIHYWKPNVNEKYMYGKIMNIKKNVYICGESFSLNQGWGEGVVSMSKDLVKKL